MMNFQRVRLHEAEFIYCISHAQRKGGHINKYS